MQPYGQLQTSQPEGPTSTLVCSSCNIMLKFPQGASNVRCAKCGHINKTAPGGDMMAQLVCSGQNCRMVLMYPRGAQQVQCSLCHTMNDPQLIQAIGYLHCDSCRTMLMYAHGASTVKCAVCNYLTAVKPGSLPGPQIGYDTTMMSATGTAGTVPMMASYSTADMSGLPTVSPMRNSMDHSSGTLPPVQ
eukprot:jgi/Botrbrau1/15949/Bobra.0260s0010.1